MCGLITQLVEHRTGIAEGTGSNPVEAGAIIRDGDRKREQFLVLGLGP